MPEVLCGRIVTATRAGYYDPRGTTSGGAAVLCQAATSVDRHYREWRCRSLLCVTLSLPYQQQGTIPIGPLSWLADWLPHFCATCSFPRCLVHESCILHLASENFGFCCRCTTYTIHRLLNLLVLQGCQAGLVAVRKRSSSL